MRLGLAIGLLCAWVAVARAQTAPKDHKLSLANGHAGLACAKCHDKGIGQKPSKGTECKDCHQRGHDTDFGNDCKACHGSIIWLSVPEDVARAVHVKTPYPLLGKHQKAPCAKCHLPTTPAQDRFRLVSHDKCLSCHEDSHKGEFAAQDLGDCKGCHDNEGFDRTSYGVARHTTFKLEGKHQATPCRGCHTSSRTSFLVGGTQCLDCHENPHGQRFAAEMAGGGCGTCHDSGDWRAPTKFPHPSFALTGAHRTAKCDACHAKGKEAGTPKTCERCHADDHAGQFGARTCDGCHTTVGWLATTVDHGKTRYPLEGVHVGMPCARCHPVTTLRNGTSAVRWNLGYFQCGDCHKSPHPASAVPASFTCKSCHGTTEWKDVTASGFDHSGTGFPLKGAHQQPACSACHKGEGKPPQQCEGCHRDTHDGRMDGACAECHTAVAWSATAELEQHRRTRMPLTGKHAVLECSACHTRQAERTWSDLPTDCYACHSNAYHTTKKPPHDGSGGTQPLSRECSLCHQTSAWKPALSNPVTRDARGEHDAVFRISTGVHRAAECESCHVDARRKEAVRCDGCHDAARHDPRVSASVRGCLRCHPQGARR